MWERVKIFRRSKFYPALSFSLIAGVRKNRNARKRVSVGDFARLKREFIARVTSTAFRPALSRKRDDARTRSVSVPLRRPRPRLRVAGCPVSSPKMFSRAPPSGAGGGEGGSPASARNTSVGIVVSGKGEKRVCGWRYSNLSATSRLAPLPSENI